MARGSSQSQTSSSTSSASRPGVMAPPHGSTAATAGMRRRRITSSSSNSVELASENDGGAGESNMLRFYTDDVSGLKISSTIVLVMSLNFIGFVTALPMFGKFYHRKSGVAAA